MNVLIIGSSGHARVIIDTIERDSTFSILGLLDDAKPPGVEENGYAILGAERDLGMLRRRVAVEALVIAIGDNYGRSSVASRVAQACPDLAFATVIHPSATIGRGSTIGPGTVVTAGVSIGPNCAIGCHCILNTHSTLDHDSMMSSFSSLGPGVVAGGNCTIGEQSAICIGATLSNNVTVGAYTVIGAGSVVLTNIPGNVVAYGTPATVRRTRSPSDRYM